MRRYSEMAVSTLGVSLSHSSSGLVFVGSVKECSHVTKQILAPGPGRSTADAALTALKREIAQRNEHAQKEARKLRTARDREQLRRRRQEDLR